LRRDLAAPCQYHTVVTTTNQEAGSFSPGAPYRKSPRWAPSRLGASRHTTATSPRCPRCSRRSTRASTGGADRTMCYDDYAALLKSPCLTSPLSQILWSDAVYAPDMTRLDRLGPEALLKLVRTICATWCSRLVTGNAAPPTRSDISNSPRASSARIARSWIKSVN
jgi:hypothetical protein